MGDWCEMISACAHVSPGAEERPLLEAVSKEHNENRVWER
jgi:hypothetical protein